MIATRHRKTPWSYLLISALVLVLGCGLYLRYEAFRTTKSMAPVSQTTSITQQTTPTVPTTTGTPASVTNPTTTVPTTGTSTDKTQGAVTDNGCGILDPKYCSTGKIVQYDGGIYVGLDLSVGGRVFSPFDGGVVASWASNGETLKGGSVIVTNGNPTKTGAGVIVAGNGLVFPRISDLGKDGGIVPTTYLFNQGDVVAALQTNDVIPGLGNTNVLIQFASYDKTVDTLFTNEAKKVQNGQETVDQLIQNMVKAVQGFTNK